MTSAYKYLAEVWPEETTDAPSGLWRTRGDETEYLSLIDWEWHPVTQEISRPPSSTFVEITTELAQTLLSDRQRFVRYWSLRQASGKENRVYRRRNSPERMVDEYFGPANEWDYSPVIKEFTAGGGGDQPDMIAIDREAAEQLIRETRGITGATDL
jgi:hypothetical protein